MPRDYNICYMLLAEVIVSELQYVHMEKSNRAAITIQHIKSLYQNVSVCLCAGP